VEARSNRPLEEGAQLHTRDDSKFRILLESEPVADRPNAKIPWFLVAASMVLLLLVLYVLFVGYLPSKQRVAGLEAELKDLYKREADLQTRIAQQDQRYALRERQISALTTERDTLIRRLEELEKLLAAARAAQRR
jgi:septal ring factor EnvC (AmiA/AmiB activator)